MKAPFIDDAIANDRNVKDAEGGVFLLGRDSLVSRSRNRVDC
jgi:hypothetical protein